MVHAHGFTISPPVRLISSGPFSCRKPRMEEEPGPPLSQSTVGLVAQSQGLTLVHFSAQPKPFLTQTHTLHTPKPSPYTP